MKMLEFIIILITFAYNLTAFELPPCYIIQGANDNPTLKIKKGTPYLFFDPGFIRDYKPEQCYPPGVKIYTDSINMKYIKGINLLGATFNKIDGSFFELRTGDTLDEIYIRNTKFDIQDLIDNLIKYNIRLCSLTVDLKYAKIFPKNIGFIKGLSYLEINFRNKKIVLDTNLFHAKQLIGLKYINRNVFNEEKYLIRNKGFKSLSLINCRKVNITKALFEKTSLEELSLTNCFVNNELLKGINQFTNCRVLILEHCGIRDNQIDFNNLKYINELKLSYNIINKFPEELICYTNLKQLDLCPNKIRDIPIKTLLNLPKRANPIHIYLAEQYLNKLALKYFKANESLLDANGYIIHLYDSYDMNYDDYYNSPDYDGY
jgi:hypothetical protein